MQNDQRNLIAFFVLAGLIFILYETFILGPQAKLQAAARARAEVSSTLNTPLPASPRLTRDQALAQSPRVRIDTPALTGSLSLKGARIDDLFLKGYHEQVSKASPLVELLRPEGEADAYFAEQGWVGANLPGLPNAQTLWTSSGGDLTPDHSVVLTYAAPGGLVFTRTIAVDPKFMFTIVDQVTNRGAAAVTLAPYASIQRIGLPPGLGKTNIVHEGAIGVLGVDSPELKLEAYKSWKKKGEVDLPSKGGWLGITDKYWMTAFIPGQSERIDGKLRVADNAAGDQIYEAAYLGAARAIAPGATVQEVSHLFGGAKVVPLLTSYQKTMGIPRFNDAVDWGHLWFLTKPIFTLLEYFYQHVGNFGVAILMLTVVIRLITFPLANKGYEMGVKMKKLQPELQALQKKNKDDPTTQQKEMMALYAREKVNPVTGCLPVLFQIPVFYSLTKIFTVTIEMRHAPFFGWIHDLSARDPTTIMNLFGLIPWDPAMTPLIGGILGGPLHVGVWPIAYGLSMWLSQSMTPTQGIDPTQQMLFKFMPFVFTFILAQYSVGLLIYWTWSSLITVLQQYVMMRRFKVENPIDSFLERFSAKPQESGVSDTADGAFSSEEVEAARVLFARQCDFVMGAVEMDGLPGADLPEIAFAGRSNVGKSSLINGLVSRHRLARASTEPGRTREINFFLLDGRVRLVDLPGYGFAKVSRATARKFQDLGRAYLRGRPNLKRVYLLIDARHGLKPPDAEALDALDRAAVSYQIVLTKADKLKTHEAAAMVAATLAGVSKRAAAFPRVLATSSETGVGLPELRAEIAAAAFA